TGMIWGLMSAMGWLVGPSSSTSSAATNTRRPWWTCGAASPTPWYSPIVSIMSSMSFCTASDLISARSSARAFVRRTGCPMRATLRIDINDDYSRHVAEFELHPHDDAHSFRFCPRCGGAFERRLLKATEPERLVCTKCSYVFYLDPKIAVGTIIRTVSERLVLVRRAIEPGYGKWVFPGGYVDRGEPLVSAAIREAREECGLDVRIDGLVNIYSYPGRAPVIVVYAATATGGTMCVDDESLESAEFDPSSIPWNDLAFRSTRDGLRDYLAGLLHPVRV